MVLNLDHPMTPHVYEAAGLIDGVMQLGQEMTVAPSTVRAELLARCLPLFAEMRHLARTHFADRGWFILGAISEYEAGICKLATLGNAGITEDRRDGEGDCPYCGEAIMRFQPLPSMNDYYIILCPRCDDLFMPAKEKLGCMFDGFGTDAI